MKQAISYRYYLMTTRKPDSRETYRDYIKETSSPSITDAMIDLTVKALWNRRFAGTACIEK